MADFDYKATRQPLLSSTQYLENRTLVNSGTLAVGALVINKTSAILRVPNRFNVTGLRFRIGDGDTGTAWVFTLGDAADPDRLVTLSTSGQAGGEITALADAGFLYEYTADTDILLTTTTAATTAVAAAFKIALNGYMR